jgi:LPPG:FO 2-phospho-L-lactate transferase
LSFDGTCVVLAGGTGGAKLAAGMQELLGDRVSVVANTADDTELLGLDVSPDPDLITYWLSGEIDEERGWGIRDDSFVVFERLVRLGAPDWFKLSDRDLATCLYRTNFIAEGGSRTGAQAQIARALGVRAHVLPMCEQRVQTRVSTPAGWRTLQEFLIADRAEAAIEAVEVAGIESAEPSEAVLGAVASAEAIVIGPSNPVISIGPIVAMPAMRTALTSASAPVVAVSPYVAGEVVKGPTDAFMRAVGRETSATGVVSLYEGLLDGIVCDADDPDPAPTGLAVHRCHTLMDDPRSRRRVAAEVLEFAASLQAV